MKIVIDTNVLNNFRGIKIVKPKDFEEMIKD